MICSLANGLWLSSALPDAIRFRRATGRVREQQTAKLLRVLGENAASDIGRRYGFESMRTVREYQARVPLHSYEDYEPQIARIATGEQGVLTGERVRLFEPTSGSVSAVKLIPYTAALQREFQRGIRPWIADLFRSFPGVMHGHAYWSVTPAALSPAPTSGGVPVGFDDDAAYVGGWSRRLVGAVMAVPPSVRRAAADSFHFETLLGLVRAGDLRLISVWNPAFLSVLARQLPACADALLRELRSDARRSQVLQAALRASTAAERHRILWPKLCVISCWADANAERPASEIRDLFPHACVQPKGLLATEAFVSFPLAGHDGAALSLGSHFFEFARVGLSGRAEERAPLLAHELEPGRRYTVIATTGGGLYRYRLNDVIEVLGHVRQCPLIRFAGKHELVSDWFGEKLHEAHVATVIRDAMNGAHAHASFSMLACDAGLTPPAYVLYLESASGDRTLSAVGDVVEAGLRRNFHYDYARLLGQLGPVRVFRAEAAQDAYFAAAAAAGRRIGDVKPLSLDCREGWSRRFRGAFIPTPSRNTLSGSAPLRLVR